MNNARILLVASVMAIVAAPVVAMMGAFIVDFLLLSGVLLIMGALGLFAGMKAVSRKSDS